MTRTQVIAVLTALERRLEARTIVVREIVDENGRLITRIIRTQPRKGKPTFKEIHQ